MENESIKPLTVEQIKDMADQTVVIGIEMGGTSCKVGAFDLNGTLMEKNSIKTSTTDA